jgi:hypothetical protein
MKRLLPGLTLLALLLPLGLYAAQPYQGDCMLGGQTVSLNGLQSTTYVMQSYVNVSGGTPVSGCSVTVFIDGSGGMHANIFSDSALSMALSNPFTADANGHFYFYAGNGAYDVQASAAGIASPFTRVISLFDPALYQPHDVFAYPLTGTPGIVGVYNGATTFYGGFTVAAGITSNYVPQWPTTDAAGCVVSNGSAQWSVLTGCLALGSNGAVQYSNSGTLAGSINFTWNNTGQSLNIIGISSTTGLSVANAAIGAGGGFISTFGSINSFTGLDDGGNLQALRVGQNSTTNAGGYLHFTPITYNPYNESGVCKDSFGNPVQQPLNLTGDSTANVDIYLWVSTSPMLPATATANCPTPGGAPFAVSPLVTVDGVPNQQWGLTTNGYMLARGGFATDNSAYNSIQSFFGGAFLATGMTTNQAIYPLGKTCSTLNPSTSTYGGLGYQGAHIFCYWNDSTLAWLTADFSKLNTGVTCSGAPTSLFATVNGITTHC